MANIEHHNIKSKLVNIPGTDLYLAQVKSGVNMNGFSRLYDTMSSRTSDVISESNPKATGLVYQYALKLFKKEPKMTATEFIEGIKNKTIRAVYEEKLSPLQMQNLVVDDNGNIILRKYGYDLEGIDRNGGNLLIHKDGSVVKDIDGLEFICKHNDFGFYPVIHFHNVEDKKSKQYRTESMGFKFMDSDGKYVSNEVFSYTQEPLIMDIPRKYSGKSGDKVFIESKSMGIYPTSHVYTDKNTVEFYPSATTMLIANRQLQEDGKAGFVTNETPYLIEHYRRRDQISEVMKNLTIAHNNGRLDDTLYTQIMSKLDDERVMINLLDTEFSKDSDGEILAQYEDSRMEEKVY